MMARKVSHGTRLQRRQMHPPPPRRKREWPEVPPPEHRIPTINTKGPVSNVSHAAKLFGPGYTEFEPVRSKVQALMPTKELYNVGLPAINAMMGFTVDC